MGRESERREGFDAVYRKHRDEIFVHVMTYVHNRADAEDILHEAFLRYYLHTENEKVDYPRSWVMTTARNLAINYLKHTKHEMYLSDLNGYETEVLLGPDVQDAFFEGLWRYEVFGYAGTVLEAVHARNKNWYNALILAYAMKKPQYQVAEEMGITLDALTSMLQRAKKWIRKHYKEEFDHITRI